MDADNQWMLRVQRGEDACFEHLVQKYRPAMLRVARSMLSRFDVAEDAVQETFLSIYRWRHSFDPSHRFRTWLWTVLLNQCRRSGAKFSRGQLVSSWSDTPGAENSNQAEPVSPHDLPPLEGLELQETRNQLGLFLGQLPPNVADALRLRFYGELRFVEIASAMGCSLLTAKNRVKRGLAELSEMLRKDARNKTTSSETDRS